jgi:tripartite-type tricarboxylate transporter receptor subunit TctC
MQRRSFLTLAAGGLAAPWMYAQAESGWPGQQIRWIVPYPPGGGTDVLARSISEAMRAHLNSQTIVVDNRPGAATNIGAELTARAKPDGYTVMSADNAVLAFNEYLFSKLPFNPEKDFTYIGAFGRFPLALVVNPAFPVKTFDEFMTHVRAHPGEVTYASPGNGSPHHLAMEMFKNRTKTSLTHIPYRGAAPALQDVMGGQVNCMFLDLPGGLPTITSNKVRTLAIGADKRVPQLPNVATLAELGVKDSEVYAFQGLLGPAGLPADVVSTLNHAINMALESPDVVQRMHDYGMQAQPGTPQQFFDMARAESRRWGPIIKATGIKLD